jgi:hypothetical protein
MNEIMNNPSREEMNARFQANESRIERRLSAIESSVTILRAEMGSETSMTRARINSDMDKSRVQINSDMDKMRIQMSSEMDKLRSDLKSEIHRGAAETIKWVAGIVISANAVGATVMTFVLNNATPKAPVSPAPINITIPEPGR